MNAESSSSAASSSRATFGATGSRRAAAEAVPVTCAAGAGFSAFNNRWFDKHEGDWEHIVVRLNTSGDATAVAYYQHLCPPTRYPWSDLAAHVEDDTHPNVFIAVHGHGAWRTAGVTKLLATCEELKGFWDRRARGRVWRPWQTGLADARVQPWYDLGVGWGREGGIGWGPVGPGRFKADSIPSNWG